MKKKKCTSLRLIEAPGNTLLSRRFSVNFSFPSTFDNSSVSYTQTKKKKKVNFQAHKLKDALTRCSNIIKKNYDK